MTKEELDSAKQLVDYIFAEKNKKNMQLQYYTGVYTYSLDGVILEDDLRIEDDAYSRIDLTCKDLSIKYMLLTRGNLHKTFISFGP